MGSCVSLACSPPLSTAPAEFARQVVKVVALDGSMAKFEGAVVVTAREALLASGGGRRRASSSPCFLCSADELGFDAPARALAAEEPLQPGRLYFVLPASKLRRPLSGRDMAALAVKAARALAVEASLAATAAGGGVSSPSRRKGGGDGEAGMLLTRKRARVTPLAVTLNNSKESRSSEDSSLKHHGYDGGRTVGKTRHGVVRGARRRAGVQRLSAIAEGGE